MWCMSCSVLLPRNVERYIRFSFSVWHKMPNLCCVEYGGTHIPWNYSIAVPCERFELCVLWFVIDISSALNKRHREQEKEKKKSINATRDQFWRMVCVCVSFASLVRPRFGPTLAKHRQTYTVTAPAFAFLFFSFGKIPSLLAFNTQPGRAGWVAFRANQQNGKKRRKQKYWKPQFDFYL